jgi:hypothetical protein
MNEPGADELVSEKDVAETEEDRPVRCASCLHPLSSIAARTKVSGKHAHTFLNPAGIEFRVLCYRSAPGCSGWGERSAVWTWFPGFAWQAALCAGCAEHVGWSFVSEADSSFFAFIDERVLEPG